MFEDFRRNESGRFVVVEAIERLLRQTKARHIILSYSSGGRATAEELNEVINSSKLVDVVEVDYKRNVMGGMRWTHEWVRDADERNREFLFLIDNLAADFRRWTLILTCVHLRKSLANMLVLIHRGTSRFESANKPDLSQVIAEEFGANATYVEDCSSASATTRAG